MFEILKRKIERKDYKLETMIEKIRILFADDEITKKEKDELENLARQNANAENSYAPLQEQIDEAFAEINLLKQTVESNAIGMSALKDAVEKLGGKIETTIEQPKEEYPEYVAPSGAHDAYKIGDKITYNGKKYTCKLDNCVWSPKTYPVAWEEVL